jgi:hypothetical protein
MLRGNSAFDNGIKHGALKMLEAHYPEHYLQHIVSTLIQSNL